MDEKLTIGRVAKKSGVGIETIRFYEREGLIPPPGRSDSGYRLYRPEDAVRLRFIRRAKELGFTLKEIRELLDLRHRPGTSKAEIRARSEAKINDIEERIAALSRMRDALARLVESCDGHGPADDCPIIMAIECDRPEGD